MDSTTGTGLAWARRACRTLTALALFLPAALASRPAAAETVPYRHAVSIPAALHTGQAPNRQVLGPTVERSIKAHLVVDGAWGPATTRALQWVLPIVRPDGVLGPTTIKALQRSLGVTADGAMGPTTIKALQRYLLVKADGVLGPTTIKALQRRLNAGTF